MPASSLGKMKITNEDEAFDLLGKIVGGFSLDETTSVEFEGWPRFVIRIKGEDFDGSIPTRIMPALLSLQHEVYKVHCRAAYGDEGTRRLTKKDRDELELVVRVDKGSSFFETLLNEPLAKIFQDAIAKMSSEQITTILIVFGLSVTSVMFWKVWINHRSHQNELDHTLELSKIEKDKMELIVKAGQLFSGVKTAAESFDGVRHELLSKMKPSDSLDVEPVLHDG